MGKIIIFTLGLLLAGCGSVSEGSGSKTHSDNKELIKLETLFEEKKYDDAYFEFHKKYKDTEKKPTQQEIDLYNKLVLSIFKKDIDKYFTSYGVLTLKEYINDKTNGKMYDLTNQKIDDLKSEITSIINNKSFDEIKQIDKESSALQKKDEELRSMIAYGLYLYTYNMEDTFDSKGNVYINENDQSFLISAIHNIQKNVNPNYTGKYSDEISKIALMQTPELIDTEYYMNYSKEQWLADYNEANNIKIELEKIEIGMTQEEVVNQTEWGKPIDINTTITGTTKSEQWVYPDNKYLYFENGILTSIQY